MEQQRHKHTHAHTQGEDNYWLQRTSPQNKGNLLAQVHELTISNHPPVVSFPGTGSIDGGRSPWDVRGSLANAQCRQVQYHHKTRCSDGGYQPWRMRWLLLEGQAGFISPTASWVNAENREEHGWQLQVTAQNPHSLSLEHKPIFFLFSHSPLSFDKFNRHLHTASIMTYLCHLYLNKLREKKN